MYLLVVCSLRLHAIVFTHSYLVYYLFVSTTSSWGRDWHTWVFGLHKIEFVECSWRAPVGGKTPRPKMQNVPAPFSLYVPDCFWFWFVNGTVCPGGDKTSHSVFCCGFPVGRFVLGVTRRPIIVHFLRWKPI